VIVGRGYIDCHLFTDWTRKKVIYMTRMKDNATYRVAERPPVPKDKNIHCDPSILFAGFYLAAGTIALVYKDRWQIGTFFRALKQLQPVRTFLGTSENAVRTRIRFALIAMLLSKFLQMKSQVQWNLSTLLVMIRVNLTEY
jgi:IS4 transposase